jgi:transcriptional regulator with XRE-family HTH domain
VNRKDFGELIASLREELGWTQHDLAQAADLEEAAVSIIERGARRHFDPDLLLGLGNALQLTTLERREFFLAASGVDESERGQRSSGGGDGPPWDSEATIRSLVGLTNRLEFPAYLIDCYGDVIAANAASIDLFQAPIERAAQLLTLPGGLTIIHFVYDESLGLRSTVTENWEALALMSMRAFREVTLRYRASPYFKYLLKRFRNPRLYPAFDRYWRRAATMDEDKYTTLDSISYRDNAHGLLTYCVSSLTSITPYGELYLSQCLPADEGTADAFREIIRRVGTRVYRFAPWPEKVMIP